MLQYHFNWKTLSVIAGITLWNFYFRMYPGSIRAPQIVAFLKQLLRHIPGKLLPQGLRRIEAGCLPRTPQHAPPSNPNHRLLETGFLMGRMTLYYAGLSKTKRSARTIPIGTETAEILAGICPAAADPKALVFGTREGLPLDRWNLLRKHLKPAAKKLGLPGVTWHLLRHSHATMLDVVERLVFGPKWTQDQLSAQPASGRVN